MSFTNKQIDMLYQMSDLHHEWFMKYNPDLQVTYDEVLKINHQKMMDIYDSIADQSEDMMDVIFESIIQDYKEMLDDLDSDLD